MLNLALPGLAHSMMSTVVGPGYGPSHGSKSALSFYQPGRREREIMGLGFLILFPIRRLQRCFHRLWMSLRTVSTDPKCPHGKLSTHLYRAMSPINYPSLQLLIPKYHWGERRVGKSNWGGGILGMYPRIVIVRGYRYYIKKITYLAYSLKYYNINNN